MRALKRVLALCSLVALPAFAAPQGTVAAVQSPAWIERGGRVQPLAVGMAIENGDRLRTGDDARVYVTLAEGSTVKLGANARLAVFGMSARPRTEFKGALYVLTGAFRFTTDALRRVKSREVMVRIGTATAGIRGTDIWGRSDANEDLVCLIEGRIDVWHAAQPGSVAMSEPMTFFVAPKGQAPKPVARVDADELRRWAQSTEIEPRHGAARAGGTWRLSLGRYAAAADALAKYDTARNAGFATQIRPFAAGSGWNYEVVLPSFPDEDEANAAATRLRAVTGIEATTAH